MAVGWAGCGLSRVFSHRPNFLIRELRFGFDGENLYFKMDASASMSELLRSKRLEIQLHLVRPEADGVCIRLDSIGKVQAKCVRRNGDEVDSEAEVAVEHSRWS